MGYFFLDIETYVDKDTGISGLNPYRVESKIIGISYNIYFGLKLEERHVTKPRFLYEWESSEEDILKVFYKDLKNFMNAEKYPKIVGFNHLGFDLPYLFARLTYYDIAPADEVHHYLYNKPYNLDLVQVGACISKFTKKHGEIGGGKQVEYNKFFNIPVKESEPTSLIRDYANGNYDGLKKYMEQEFTFELLYIRLKKLFKIFRKSIYRS